MMPKPFTEETLLEAVQVLAARDPDLARVVSRWGPPPLWQRAPGFGTLLYIILEQQVSLASARAAYEKLVRAAGRLTPERFLAFSDAELKTIGFSRQKTAYGRHLAAAVIDGSLDFALLAGQADEAVRAQLVKIKGIGSWSADIYLLMALGRPDIWPSGDLALALAAQRVKGLAARPTPEELNTIGARWRPWRAAAARILWHDYLSTRASAQEKPSLL